MPDRKPAANWAAALPSGNCGELRFQLLTPFSSFFPCADAILSRGTPPANNSCPLINYNLTDLSFFCELYFFTTRFAVNPDEIALKGNVNHIKKTPWR